MQPTDRFIICADILGFSRLVCEGSPDEIRRALDRMLNPRDGLFPDAAANWLRRGGFDYAVFSDTILVWTPDDGDGRLEATVELAGLMIAMTLQREVISLPLRLGIARGPLHVDPAASIFFGRGLLRAYYTEQKQDWLGGALHPSVSCDEIQRVNRASARKRVQYYPAPVHANRHGCLDRGNGRAACISWPRYAGPPEFIRERLAELRASAGPAAGKYDAASAFYERFQKDLVSPA